MRFGIPDFKLNKSVIDRRLDLLKEEGIEFKCGICVGTDISIDELLKDFDAVCLAMGAEVPRDLKVDGRDLKGVHFALELLQQQNRVNAGAEISREQRISAKKKMCL